MTRRALIAKVHVARNQTGMDDDAYRDLLARLTGKRSAADCTDADLLMVLDAFKQLGWEPRTNPAASRRPGSSRLHVRKVFALWGDLARRGALRDGSRPALAAFVARQTGVSDPDWLTALQANAVTEALKAIRDRHAQAAGPTP